MKLYESDQSQFLQELGRKLELKNRDWLIKFLYHFSDILNIVSILKMGKILSRDEAVQSGIMFNDNASNDVIVNTQHQYKKCARLYFRPKTPTQFHNEGFISAEEASKLNAHCPIPVMLLFDSAAVLQTNGVKVSNRHIASSDVEVSDDESFFQKLPFEDIYHDSPLVGLEDWRKDEIIKRRHAEVLLPGTLPLTHLKFIVCRSEAELNTLKELLDPDTLETYQDKMKVDSKKYFFFMNRPFVKEVSFDYDKNRIRFEFNDNAKAAATFKYHYHSEFFNHEAINTSNNQKAINLTHRLAKYYSPPKNISIAEIRKFSLFIDGHIACIVSTDPEQTSLL